MHGPGVERSAFWLPRQPREMTQSPSDEGQEALCRVCTTVCADMNGAVSAVKCFENTVRMDSCTIQAFRMSRGVRK